MQVFHSYDASTPSVTCPSYPSVSTTSQCNGTIPDLKSGASVIDVCSTVLSQSPASGTLVSVGVSTTITVYANNPGT
jgi:hypothetical protein